MKKYYKRMLTYYEVSENGSYIAITPLISQTTITVGIDFRKTNTETEITASEFHSETTYALGRFWKGVNGLMYSKVL